MVWPVSCVKSVVLLTMPWCGAYLDTCGKPGFQASAAKQQEDGPLQYPLQAPSSSGPCHLVTTLSELAWVLVSWSSVLGPLLGPAPWPSLGPAFNRSRGPSSFFSTFAGARGPSG